MNGIASEIFTFKSYWSELNWFTIDEEEPQLTLDNDDGLLKEPRKYGPRFFWANVKDDVRK